MESIGGKSLVCDLRVSGWACVRAWAVCVGSPALLSLFHHSSLCVYWVCIARATPAEGRREGSSGEMPLAPGVDGGAWRVSTESL